MCRLLAVVSATPGALPSLLGDNLAPYTALSEQHADGWGHASWGAAGALDLHKEAARAATSDFFHSSVGVATTDAAVLHLRRASAGMHNAPENTHPFVADDLAFAHNGWATPNETLDELIAAAGGETVTGTTDSERYFALVRALIPALGPAVALAEAGRRIVAVARVEALNALLLTPDALYAYCWFDEDEMLASGKVHGDYDLHYTRATADGSPSVVVASTGWDRHEDEWALLPKGAVLEVTRPRNGARLPSVTVFDPELLLA